MGLCRLIDSHSVNYNCTLGQFSLTFCIKLVASTVYLLAIGTNVCEVAVYQLLGDI